MAIVSFLTSRVVAIPMAIALAATLILCATLAIKLHNRNGEVAALADRIENPRTGYIATNNTLRNNNTVLDAALTRANIELDRLKLARDTGTANANSGVSTAKGGRQPAAKEAARIGSQAISGTVAEGLADISKLIGSVK